jgi:hypothetical protein
VAHNPTRIRAPASSGMGNDPTGPRSGALARAAAIMARPGAWRPPHEVPGESLDRRPFSPVSGVLNGYAILSVDELSVNGCGPKSVVSLRFGPSRRPPRPPIPPLLTNSVAGPLARFVQQVLSGVPATTGRFEECLTGTPDKTLFIFPPGTGHVISRMQPGGLATPLGCGRLLF